MTLSLDGKFMWNGTEWIPAPPSAEGAPAAQSVQTAPSMPQQVIIQQTQQPKSFGVAMIFNFIWAGIGHLYLDESKGLTMAIITLICALTIFLIPVSLIVWIVSMAQTRRVHNEYLVRNGFATPQ